MTSSNPHTRAVVEAWINPGPQPDYHEMAKRKLRSDWPSLFYALLSFVDFEQLRVPARYVWALGQEPQTPHNMYVPHASVEIRDGWVFITPIYLPERDVPTVDVESETS